MRMRARASFLLLFVTVFARASLFLKHPSVAGPSGEVEDSTDLEAH